MNSSASREVLSLRMSFVSRPHLMCKARVHMPSYELRHKTLSEATQHHLPTAFGVVHHYSGQLFSLCAVMRHSNSLSSAPRGGQVIRSGAGRNRPRSPTSFEWPVPPLPSAPLFTSLDLLAAEFQHRDHMRCARHSSMKMTTSRASRPPGGPLRSWDRCRNAARLHQAAWK